IRGTAPSARRALRRAAIAAIVTHRPSSAHRSARTDWCGADRAYCRDRIPSPGHGQNVRHQADWSWRTYGLESSAWQATLELAILLILGLSLLRRLHCSCLPDIS